MKKKIMIPLCVFVVLLVVGTSFALWQLTFRQTGTNVVTTGCFKVEFTDKDPISLTDAMPMTSDDGKKLVPYQFTITNICDKETDYYINLETLATENPLTEEYLRASLATDVMEVFSDTLKEKYINQEKVILDSGNAYMLYGGTLLEKESRTFLLRLWLDGDTPLNEDTMNKTYQGKVTVLTTYVNDSPTKNMMISMGVSNPSYEPKRNNVYTQNSKYKLSKVSFEKTITNYENVEEVVDFSNNGDKSVQGYYVKDNPEADDSKYTLHIQANGRIQANRDATLYFSIPDDSEVVFEGIENIDTSFVEKMNWMFYKYNGDSLDLSNFNTRNVTDMSRMFYECEKLTNLNLDSFNTSKVTDMQLMFYKCNNLVNLDLSNFDTRNVVTMNNIFHMCEKLTNLDISSFNTSKVTNMRQMFYCCYKLTALDLTNFDTRCVTTMYGMFYYCYDITMLNISSFDTSNVTDVSNMFNSCRSLISLDVSVFNTSKVTNMRNMFSGCNNLTSLDVSGFDTGKVIYIDSIFSECRNLKNLDVSNFDTSKMVEMNSMFSGCSSLTTLDLSNFDTSKAKNMNSMFYGCSNLVATITIRNSGISDVNRMFVDAATGDSAQITVNYTSATSDTVDQMIATKSSNSNVVKGSLVS